MRPGPLVPPKVWPLLGFRLRDRLVETHPDEELNTRV